MKILGIDASTKTIGWALSTDKIIENCGFIDISKRETNKEKSLCFLSTIKCIENLHHINLESPLLGFGFGHSSQQTIIKLIKFNTILEYILSEELKLSVNLINVNSARKQVLGKARIKGIPSKEYVKQELPKVVTDIYKFDILNKKGNVDKRMEDVWDAIIMSLFG